MSRYNSTYHPRFVVAKEVVDCGIPSHAALHNEYYIRDTVTGETLEAQIMPSQEYLSMLNFVAHCITQEKI